MEALRCAGGPRDHERRWTHRRRSGASLAGLLPSPALAPTLPRLFAIAPPPPLVTAALLLLFPSLTLPVTLHLLFAIALAQFLATLALRD